MSLEPEVIGVDIGGTSIKLGRFNIHGKCDQAINVPTPTPASPKLVVDALVQAIDIINPQKTCLALGIGVPGVVDSSGRIAKVAINLSGWLNVPLAQQIESATGLATTLANDANCAGVGEAWLGAGLHYQDMILLTLGTGVGGAIILGGKLFTGHLGAAGELGLIMYDPDGPVCNSGNKGSLEQHLSIAAIKRMTGKEPEQMGILAQAGDPVALDFWREYGRILGTGVTSFIYTLTPEVIIIGGGVGASADFFLPSALQEIEKRVLPPSREGFKLLKAELGNQAGMVGAAKLAWELVKN
jgi:glucokinase